jgi:hypothetical protein
MFGVRMVVSGRRWVDRWETADEGRSSEPDVEIIT